jgi:hypothetical protein
MGTGDDHVVREAQLAGGRILRIRHAEPADALRLQGLYESLPIEDRRRRFFSGSIPRSGWLTRWIQGSDRGGACLVAEVTEGDSSDIVAEAGYARLGDGDGELGITVSPDWRGWLAPFLLDALLEVAAAAGIPNLQAELLTENRPMLGLVRARGQAVLDNTDATTIRVSISTRGGIPTWPGRRQGTRVLVELCSGISPAEHAARHDATAQVVGCPGPPPGHPERCPLLTGQRCPLVDAADVVVVVARPGDDRVVPLLEGHHRRQAGAPVAVEVWPESAEAAIGAAPEAAVIRPLTTPAEIRAVLHQLVGPAPGS